MSEHLDCVLFFRPTRGLVIMVDRYLSAGTIPDLHDALDLVREGAEAAGLIPTDEELIGLKANAASVIESMRRDAGGRPPPQPGEILSAWLTGEDRDLARYAAGALYGEPN